MSLPFFGDYGWEAEVVCVKPTFSDIVKDELLEQSIPSTIKIHKVGALPKKWTSKLGLGSIAIRSLLYYKTYVDRLLESKNFDLIYFSTTQFPVLILGKHWLGRYGVPYVIDMQDPWHSTYYDDKPKNERPKKYWFSYRLNKFLEPIAMSKVGGLISVSEGYINTLKERYPEIRNVPSSVITFGAFERDFEVAEKNKAGINAPKLDPKFINLVYVGRGGYDLKDALSLLFGAFKKGLIEKFDTFSKLKFHFIGTSYAPKGEGIPTILPLAKEFEIADYVLEQTDRISFYESIKTLQNADALLILGSNDEQYTASKIYPYILAERPILSFFNPKSSAAAIIQECNAGELISLTMSPNDATESTFENLLKIAEKTIKTPSTNWSAFEKYSAKEMTKKQCLLFDQVLNNECI